MRIVRVYVDGFNMYHAVDKLEDNRLKWLNYWQLCTTLVRPGETLNAVHFFTAVWPYEAAKQKRHENFINALDAVGVQVHRGSFSKPRKWCEEKQRYCWFREEKQTDVAIAVRMLADAADGQDQQRLAPDFFAPHHRGKGAADGVAQAVGGGKLGRVPEQ